MAEDGSDLSPRVRRDEGGPVVLKHARASRTWNFEQ